MTFLLQEKARGTRNANAGVKQQAGRREFGRVPTEAAPTGSPQARQMDSVTHAATDVAGTGDRSDGA
jgi:hypothetical protein